MADQYGMVTLMKRTYRVMQCAVDAGLRHAKHTGKPCYVGMLLDCRFHLSDEDPAHDWRWDAHLACQPTGETYLRRGRR